MIDDRVNDVLAIFQELGPRRRIAVDIRWAEAFPGSTHEQMCRWIELCHQIESFAILIAERVRAKHLDKATAIQELADKFPFLNSDRIAHTYSQAMFATR